MLDQTKASRERKRDWYVLRPWDRRERGAFTERIKVSVAQALRVNRKVLEMSLERKVGPDLIRHLSFVEDFGH